MRVCLSNRRTLVAPEILQSADATLLLPYLYESKQRLFRECATKINVSVVIHTDIIFDIVRLGAGIVMCLVVAMVVRLGANFGRFVIELVASHVIIVSGVFHTCIFPGLIEGHCDRPVQMVGAEGCWWVS